MSDEKRVEQSREAWLSQVRTACRKREVSSVVEDRVVDWASELHDELNMGAHDITMHVDLPGVPDDSLDVVEGAIMEVVERVETSWLNRVVRLLAEAIDLKIQTEERDEWRG